MSSVLDFLGIQSNGPASQPSELDRALTEWILQHAPTTKNTVGLLPGKKKFTDLNYF